MLPLPPFISPPKQTWTPNKTNEVIIYTPVCGYRYKHDIYVPGVSVSYIVCAQRRVLPNAVLSWCSIFLRLVFQSYTSASVTVPLLLLFIPSLFWQRETPNDNNRRHKGDLCPKITHGKSSSLFFQYLSPCLLTLCLPLVSEFVYLFLFFSQSVFQPFFIQEGGFRWACMLFLSYSLFHIHTVAHLHGVFEFRRAQLALWFHSGFRWCKTPCGSHSGSDYTGCQTAYWFNRIQETWFISVTGNWLFYYW